MPRSYTRVLLCAKVAHLGASDDFNDALSGHPLARRINRLERACESFRAQISLRSDDEIVVVLKSANTALRCACEMQQRCAALPRPTVGKMALRIGLLVLNGDYGGGTRETIERTRETAERLACLDDAVLSTHALFDQLSPYLRELLHPLPVEQAPEGVDTSRFHTVDWRRQAPSESFNGEVSWPLTQAPPLHAEAENLLAHVHFGTQNLRLTRQRPRLVIGRAPACDLVLDNAHVSRQHCRLDSTEHGVVLTDTSTNGTTVVTDDNGGSERLVKQASLALSGQGLLILGYPFKGDTHGAVFFEIP